MGLPALRSQPHTGTEQSSHVRDANESLNGFPSQRSATTSLRAIIESVFDAGEDRVIYELPADDPHGDEDGQSITAGTGVAVAVACAHAFARLGRSQFVVLVADGASWQREFASEISGLLGVRQRFVILLPAVDADAGTAAQLSFAGWRVADCRGRSTARVIAKTLVEARFDQRPTLIGLDADVIAAAQQTVIVRSPSSANSPEVAAADTDGTTMVVHELQERAAADPRLVPIVVTDHTAWQPLARFGNSEQSPNPRRVERELSIAAALSDSGCRPVIVMEQALLGANREAVQRTLSRPRFRGTFVVPGSEWSIRESMVWPAAVEQHVLPSRVDSAEIGRVVSACLSAKQSSVLLLPRKPVVGISPPPESPSIGTGFGGSPRNQGDGEPHVERAIPFAVSAQSAQSDQQEIEHKRLRLEALRWVQDYDRVGHRNLYLWRWCLHGIELTTFPGIPDGQLTHLHDTKLLSVILCVLFDDVADRNGRKELLESLIQSAGSQPPEPAGILDRAEREYVEVTRRLWLEYEARVRQYPQYSVYERLWRFDLLQFLNTMRYAHLVNSQPGLLNLAEHDVYTPHNMLMVSFSTLDLMCVAHFHTAELGSLREAMWHAQSMGRIGNVLSTWRRELAEADQSSGMFGDDSSLSMSSKEQLLLEKWRWHRSRCHAAAERVASIDLNSVLNGHDRFFDMHLASSGRI